jgi:hypothetical protein
MKDLQVQLPNQRRSPATGVRGLYCPNEKQPDKLDVIAVLKIQPVVSPETAVRVEFAAKVSSRR